MHKIPNEYDKHKINKYFNSQYNIDLDKQDDIYWTEVFPSLKKILIKPEIGDVFVFIQYNSLITRTRISPIYKCDCKNIEYKWPDKDYFNQYDCYKNICGPHIKFNNTDECIWSHNSSWWRTGLLFSMGKFNRKEEITKKENKCPICGTCGNDLIFKFYCSNTTCQNFHL